jgi:carbon-monoxide dehydrogenase medium subunit
MYEFEYHKPSSLAEAASLLGADAEAKLLAGGQTYLPTLKQRLARPTSLIDLSGLAELKGIKEEAGGVTIGAMTRHVEVENSDVVKRVIPALAEMAHLIGDPAVRSLGTIGGSVSNNDPAADYPAAVTISRATTDADLTVTVFEIDVPLERLLETLPGLVRPDWRERVDEVVAETVVETVFQDVEAFGSTQH